MLLHCQEWEKRRQEFTLQYEKGNPKLLKRKPQNTFKTNNQMEEIDLPDRFAADLILH